MSAESSSQPKPAFSVRIVVCDHYSTKPIPGIDVVYSEFRGSDIKQVPVLRIFGSAPDGHKACLHVHGVFPYFCVPCPVTSPEPQFLYQMAASLDKALNIAMKQATSTHQHVYKISLVKGLPFYGYHTKEHLYLKIFLYNPGLVKQAVELCSNGAILGQTFQPHEAHLNFTLQFFIDFNLFGMSNIDLESVRFRKKYGTSQSSDDLLNDEDSFLKPESVCHYEADCSACHIINRQRVGRADGIENPGLEEVWEQERQRRHELNMSMASKSLSQGRLKAEETDSHHKFQQMCLIKLSKRIEKPVDVADNASQCLDVSYPAELADGSQLLNASDATFHLPHTTSSVSLSDTLRHEESAADALDNTLVDETVAMNSSLHYSQVVLDNEDLDLVEMLQELEAGEGEGEGDSVLAPPHPAGDDSDQDDADYSQIYNEDTVIVDPHTSECNVDESSPSWNDSFWEDAHIAQLDGTCDDDHVKKVRKRKMRPFKLGLSRPKCTKKIRENIKVEPTSNLDSADSDEINASRETIDSVSSLHLKKSIKIETESVLATEEVKLDDSQKSNNSLVELVNKATAKYENVKERESETYDLKNNFEPVAGPSTCNIKETKNDAGGNIVESNDESFESSPDSNDLGFISFYNSSKLFDTSLGDNNRIIAEEVAKNQDNAVTETEKEPHHVQNIENFDTKLDTSEEDMKLHYSETLQATKNSLVNSCSNKITSASLILTPKIRAPTRNYITSTLQKYNLPEVKHPQPYYSDHKDVGDKVEIGQMVLKLHSHSVKEQTPFEKVLNTTSIEEWRQLTFIQNSESMDPTTHENLKSLLAGNRQCVLESIRKPPTKKQVIKWIEDKTEGKVNVEDDRSVEKMDATNVIDDLDNSQAIGLIDNSISLESGEKQESVQVTGEPDGAFLCHGSADTTRHRAAPLQASFLTVMVCELVCGARGELLPDPLHDQVHAACVSLTCDSPPGHPLPSTLTELVVVGEEGGRGDACAALERVVRVRTEPQLLERVAELIRAHDPDILGGYEIEMSSWGYLAERAGALGLELDMSRVTDPRRRRAGAGRAAGRVLLDVWRLLRHELPLSSYSFESCMLEVVGERVPRYSAAQLHAWWARPATRWVALDCCLTRARGTLRILDKLDIINRTSELARLFGIQWWEVLSRGSQFRVESLMLRAARPHNLVALSPTVRQRATMPAPATLPLIYEPESRFYSSPVIVLDFQSLYPSMMIAYNYCYSTCIGNLSNITGDAPYQLGAWRLRVPRDTLSSVVSRGQVHWSPVGAGFVSSEARRGVLPALLRRILAARQAVKASMKLHADGDVRRALHSRQLGLKLIANVTYGYTAANFSGRMPCVEVADSVVAKGRETLERAIKLVESGNWNVKVVYGDTDSMFVEAAGRSLADAFRIGREIAAAVTADNPSPVALKLEKVYQPCLLQTKKRYVGYMYESESAAPQYEAKGIETVRRDGCPAGVKILQRSLVELFESGDMSAVKRHVTSLLRRVAAGTLPPRELLLTREYHGAAGYRPGAAAPPLEIARRLSRADGRAAPRAGERVAWLVTAGAPGLPLVKLARTPLELRRDPALTPHVHYYVTRVLLPPLHRCLSLLGVNVFKWWTELGCAREVQGVGAGAGGGGGIARYLWRERCALCGTRALASLCDQCAAAPQRPVAALCTQLNVATTHLHYCDKMCASCSGHTGGAAACENTECAAWWRRRAARRSLAQLEHVLAHLPAHLCDTHAAPSRDA